MTKEEQERIERIKTELKEEQSNYGDYFWYKPDVQFLIDLIERYALPYDAKHQEHLDAYKECMKKRIIDEAP